MHRLCGGNAVGVPGEQQRGWNREGGRQRVEGQNPRSEGRADHVEP